MDEVFAQYPPIPDVLKEWYPMTCAHCGHEQRVVPCLMMQAFGLNTGAANCLGCKIHLHLWIDGDEIKSEPYAELLTRLNRVKKEA